MDCIFCKIISGEIPCSKIYEDDLFIAFLDIRPIRKGHTLIVPKRHFESLFDTPAEESAAIYAVTAKVAAAVRDATKSTGINIIQNNGADAGQEVFHSHIHIIPRSHDDGLKFERQHDEYSGFEEMGKLAHRIHSLTE